MSPQEFYEIKDERDQLRTENAQLKAQLERFHAAMEKEKSGEWREELIELANILAFSPGPGYKITYLTPEVRERAARELRATADIYTHKANMVPRDLEIKELKAQLEQAQRDREHFKQCTLELGEQFAKSQKERDRAQAACVDFKEHWRIGRGRVMANFGHVSECVRVINWLDHELHSVIYNTDCGKGYVNVAELTPTIELMKHLAQQDMVPAVHLEEALGILRILQPQVKMWLKGSSEYEWIGKLLNGKFGEGTYRYDR